MTTDLGEKQLFEHYKRTAPPLDLALYLDDGLRLVADYHLPAPAVRRVGEMAVLADQLRGASYKPAHRTQVWTLIARYKAAVPKWWQGRAGLDGWQRPTPLTPEEALAFARACASETLQAPTPPAPAAPPPENRPPHSASQRRSARRPSPTIPPISAAPTGDTPPAGPAPWWAKVAELRP